MPDSVPDTLLPDKPLDDPGGDRLGYASFAERIAECVSKRIPVDGLVVAVHGAWGCGKSTVLNFVKHYLEALPEARRPIVVRFNPWWFSGREDIVLQFFGQLRRALSGLRVKAQDVAQLIADLTGALSSFAGPYGPYGAAAAQATKALLPDQTDVHKLKVKIEKALIGSDQPVVFIIDDIDRLAKEEIRELFTAIRAIADFPKICYLLAFDWEVVAEALSDVQGSNGEDYLAKIVQVPISLPPPARTALDHLFEERLFPLFKATPPELLDEERFKSFYSEGLRHFINTPRDIIRLVNSVMLFYQEVRGEVKCPDYVAVKALNVFCPMAHDVVANNKEMFAFLKEDTLEPGIRMDELKRFHKPWLGRVDERDRTRVRRLISVMFPKLGAIMEGLSNE
ncbi:MAG: KAP family NTPase [Candidatus Coatesbacteria bacterium]|nr:KAP family NTPase [Candidatus Coatesbacteria bacterium]